MILVYWAYDQGPGPEHYKHGDVICFVEDDHVFSKLELSNPDWRMLKVALTETECQALTVPPPRPENAPKTAVDVRRLYRLNLQQLKGFADASLKDDARKQPILDASLKSADLRAAVEQKAAAEIAPKLPDVIAVDLPIEAAPIDAAPIEVVKK